MPATLGADTISRCILELLNDPRFVRLGCSLGELERIIVSERGFSNGEFNAALGRLRREKQLTPRDNPPLEPVKGWLPDTLLTLSARGKQVLKGLRTTSQFNLRAPQSLLQELGSPPVLHQGESPSQAGLRLLEEGVRMEKFPGTAFRWDASGRRPFVLGSGLSVWEVFHLWTDFGRNPERIAKAYPYLNVGQVNVAVAYACAFIHEMPVGEWGEKPAFAREVKV